MPRGIIRVIVANFNERSFRRQSVNPCPVDPGWLTQPVATVLAATIAVAARSNCLSRCERPDTRIDGPKRSPYSSRDRRRSAIWCACSYRLEPLPNPSSDCACCRNSMTTGCRKSFRPLPLRRTSSRCTDSMMWPGHRTRCLLRELSRTTL